MRHLNDHNCIQHAPQGWVAWWRRWRIHNNCKVYILLSSRVTKSRRPRCIACRRLDSRVFKPRFQLSCSLPKECGTNRSYTGSDVGKSSKPRSNKILCIKTRKNRPWDFALLLWTSTREWMKIVGKLIGASVTRAYKNTHLSIRIVWRWEIGQILWQEI